MVFADLVGYTAYCSSRDPEEVHLVVRPLMNGLRTMCESLGGSVPVIDGDGFMAVFGAKETRSDDPRRAVLACARMQEVVHARTSVVGEALAGLRVGINVGEVLVAPSWERGDVSISGDVVNIASRLCKAAGEGEVLASVDVVACVPLGAWEDAREVNVRGVDEAIGVATLDWEAVSEPAAVWWGESRTPYVSRPELADVSAAMWRREVLLVVGEPGIGKSRLLTEAVAATPGALLLRSRFSDLEPGSVGAAALAAEVLEQLPVDARPSAVTRRLRRLVGDMLDTDETDSYAEQLDALSEALLTLAALRPIVVVLDDVDMAAEAERSFVASVVRASPGSFSLLMTARRPLPLAIPEITLGPLDQGELAAFVGRVLPGAPQVLVTHLVERSGGVPLFVEQYARLLLEDGTVRIEDGQCLLVAPERLGSLPTAMRLFVAARLDTLDGDTRRVVAFAAVAGPTVDVDLLAFLAGRGTDLAEHIEVLVDRGFLEWLPPDRQAPARLRFRHEVLRDVAYDGLLRSDRIATHRAAAEWYAVLPVVQVLAEEARHLEAAIALGETDCTQVRRAVEVLGQHAASVIEENPSLSGDVVARAERLAEGHPQCNIDLLAVHVTKARVMLHGGDQAGASALARDAAARAAGEANTVLEAVGWLTAGLAESFPAPEASAEALRRAETLFREADDMTGVARVEAARAEGLVPLATRLAAWERAYRAAIRGGEGRLASLAAQDLAMHTALRSPAEAERWRQTASELRRADDVVGAARLVVAEALIALMRLDYDACARTARAAAAAAQDAGNLHLYMNAALFELESLVLSGQLVEAERVLGVLLELAATRPTDHLRVDALTFATLLRSRQGRGREAAVLLEQMRPASAALGPHYEAQWHGIAGRVALERGAFAEATAHAGESARREKDLDLAASACREQTVDLVSRLASGAYVGLTELADARTSAREFGAETVAAALGRWSELSDTLAGMSEHRLDPPDGPSCTETRALDLELTALRESQPELLLAASREWSDLGTTVWQARALLWHSELTGADHPEADELLTALDAPTDLAATLRAQVRGLRN